MPEESKEWQIQKATHSFSLVSANAQTQQHNNPRPKKKYGGETIV